MSATDTAPAFSARDVDDLAGPPPAPIEPPTPDLPPKPSKRPTTRAGRRAASAANQITKGKTTPDKGPKAPATPRKATLETRLTGQLVSIGTGVAVAGAMLSPAFQADGVLIVQNAGNVAKALDKVAQDQPQVKAALERMLTAGVWSGLATAMAPLVLGIAANHGMVPASVAAMLGAQAQVPEDQAPPGGGVESIHVA